VKTNSLYIDSQKQLFIIIFLNDTRKYMENHENCHLATGEISTKHKPPLNFIKGDKYLPYN